MARHRTEQLGRLGMAWRGKEGYGRQEWQGKEWSGADGCGKAG